MRRGANLRRRRGPSSKVVVDKRQPAAAQRSSSRHQEASPAATGLSLEGARCREKQHHDYRSHSTRRFTDHAHKSGTEAPSTCAPSAGMETSVAIPHRDSEQCQSGSGTKVAEQESHRSRPSSAQVHRKQGRRSKP